MKKAQWSQYIGGCEETAKANVVVIKKYIFWYNENY